MGEAKLPELQKRSPTYRFGFEWDGTPGTIWDARGRVHLGRLRRRGQLVSFETVLPEMELYTCGEGCQGELAPLIRVWTLESRRGGNIHAKESTS